ncbi:helix-turn-helix domain-containing protein [Niveispirillum fermenti]|uniref:helix-turn-helix domain-containing protein n=1 Tax=Niveispirillum fermenti TaxID=1233113 RepID=UPI003A8B1636
MLYTLEEAALMIRPDGLVSARSLRAEVAAGRLRPTRIAGRIFVTHDDLTAFLQTARQPDNHARKNTGQDWPPCHSSVTKLSAVANALTKRKAQ